MLNDEETSELKWIREPLLHFLFIGAAIYLLYGAVVESVPEETDKTIIVSAGEVEWMRTNWGPVSRASRRDGMMYLPR